MARLPSAKSLGARPTPDSRRALGTINPGAAASIGRAASGLGDDLVATGDRIGRANAAKQADADRLALAWAKTNLAKADAAARTALADDPDFDTYGDRYAKAMAKARNEIGGTITEENRLQSAYDAMQNGRWVTDEAEGGLLRLNMHDQPVTLAEELPGRSRQMTGPGGAPVWVLWLPFGGTEGLTAQRPEEAGEAAAVERARAVAPAARAGSFGPMQEGQEGFGDATIPQ